MLCVDREGAARTTVYGYLDMTSGAGTGFQSVAGHAGISLGITDGGPEASLVLPLGRWLGIQSWLPIEAEFSIGADSFYIGPVLRKSRCSEYQDSDEVSARDLLPLGLRSRCVLRLY
jgi:hypothetical protein